MSYILGIGVSFVCIHLSLLFLDQNFGMYFDDVAISIVLGCTIAVSLIVMPWNHWRVLRGRIFKMFKPNSLNQKKLIGDCLNFVQGAKSGSFTPFKSKHLAHRVLNDGKELIDLHFKTDEIESVLHERVHQDGERTAQISGSFSSLAKYPPAFGLIGTVFGLVNLMRAISDGLDPTQTGVKMAIALVATLYGLLLANLVISPIAEVINKQASDERHLADIALQAVILASDGTSLLKSQEMLNSFVPEEKRVNYIKSAMEAGEAA